MDLDAYRARAQAFATDLNRAHHRRFAGHDGAWDPESLYAHHAAAYDDAAIDALRERPPRPRRPRGACCASPSRPGWARRPPGPTPSARAPRPQAGLADLTAALAAEPRPRRAASRWRRSGSTSSRAA